MAQEAKVNTPKRGVIGSMITSPSSSQLLLMQFNDSFDVHHSIWYLSHPPSPLAIPYGVVFVSHNDTVEVSQTTCYAQTFSDDVCC